MSRLADLIRRVSQQESRRPIGFGGLTSPAPQPTMLTIARLTTSLKAAPENATNSIDTLILPLASFNKNAAELAKSSSQVSVGVQVQGTTVDLEFVRQMKASGIDYIVFRPEEMEAGCLVEEAVGFMMCVREDASEKWLHFAAGLGLDAIMLEGDLPQLTVGSLITLRRLVALTQLPLLVPWQQSLTSETLESLRNIGVIGLMADVKNWDEMAALAELRQRILALPARQHRRKEKHEVMLPAPAAAASMEEEEEEDE